MNTLRLEAQSAASASQVESGLRSRLPVESTEFVDIRKEGIDSLWNDSFGLIRALDIIEYVDDDEKALAEISRVAAQGAILILPTPLHPSLFVLGNATPYREG